MHRTDLHVIALSTIALGTVPANAQDLHIVPGVQYFTGISADGRVAAGYTFTDFLYWTLDGGVVYIGGAPPGTQGIGGSCDISSDGARILGNTFNASGKTEASVYSIPDGAWTSTGSLGFNCDISSSSGWAISGDGMTVGGLIVAAAGCDYRGLHYSPSMGIRTLPTAYFYKPTRVNAINENGTVLVGWNDDYNGWRQGSVWVWNGTSYTQTLITTPNGVKMGEASAVSADGTKVFGSGPIGGAQRNYVWTLATKAVSLGDSPTGLPSYVTACNADGTVAACFFRAGPPATSGEGYVWIQGRGYVALEEWAAENNVDVPFGVRMSLPLAMSADGRSVAGAGRTDFGDRAFVLNLGPLASCEGDIDRDGAVDGLDLTALLASWGPCGAGACGGDLNNDSVVNGLDLTVILSAWGNCP
jgi:uncharacterized membrane protein